MNKKKRKRLINYKCHLGTRFTVTFSYALKTHLSLGDSSWRKQVSTEKFNYSPKISIV
jgi:hypothetical protein